MNSALEPWAAVARRLFAQRGVRAALLALALLASSAVFAPFLASDKPYLLVALDRRAYATSLDALEPLARSWNERLLGAAAALQAADPTEPASLHAAFEARAALTRELRALELRLATLRRYAPVERAVQAPLDELEHRARGWTNKVVEGELDDLAPAAGLVAAAARLRETHRPASAEADGLTLRERRSFPLLAALAFSDWWSAWIWSGALVLVLLRAPLRASWRQLALALGATALLAWLCGAGFRAPAGLATPALKEALSNGDVVASAAVFAPLPYGFDESNLSEALRPPTWLAAAEIDEAGRYVRGPRAPRPDPATGFVPVSAPVAVRAAESARNSAWRHLLGTDVLGRDVLARVLWGGRASLLVGLGAGLAVTALGTLLGLLAGYFRGWFDDALAGVIGVLQSFPPFFLILTAVALGAEGELGRRLPPLALVVAVIALAGWTGVARLVRAESLRVRELDYVLAARALGFGPLRILARHVLPNVVAPALVAAAFVAVSAILTESAVSFLGFGVRAPTPSWGALMQEARSSAHAWIFVFPGLCVFATCLALSRLGDAARDALDPREDA